MKHWEYELLYDPDHARPTRREVWAVTAIVVVALVLVIISVYVMFF